MATVRITFTPDEVGWAWCELSIDSVTHRMPSVSDMTDPLGDLVRATLMIVTGAAKATASFTAEPLETRWILETAWFEGERWHEGFRVRLLEFESILDNQPDELGAPVFAGKLDAGDFSRAVLIEAERLMRPENASWLTGDNAPGIAVAVRALRAALN